MVTNEGLWKTVESGRSWTKLPRSAATKWLTQVCFLDENKGWAIGERKSVYMTVDGGKKWSRVDAAEKVNTKPENTTFRTIAFADALNGMIVGQSAPPPPPDRLPAYLQPELSNRRELPHLTIVLETRDGGKTWKPTTTSVFGQVTKVALIPDGTALSLFQFRGAFDHPAEIARHQLEDRRRDPRDCGHQACDYRHCFDRRRNRLRGRHRTSRQDELGACSGQVEGG